MNINQMKSGVLVATEDRPTPVRPEHPVCDTIREHLRHLAHALGQYEQTTHVSFAQATIGAVCECLIECYEKPDGYTISDLSQAIKKFLGEQK